MTLHVPRFADLIATTDPSEFTAAPIGRCFVGPSFAIWCASPELQGSILWGALEERSIRDMMTVGQFIHHRAIAPRRRSISDCRHLERAAADVLLGFVTSARADVASWTHGLERQALIVPSGVGGILISGALPMTGIAHAMRVVHELDEALAFVDHPAAETAHAAASSIVAARRGPSVLLSRLRAQLGREHRATSIERSAAALGMSTRTLQRELHELGTSYSSELRRARIAVAEMLLVQTDRKIESIAAQVGFGTASRMSASLRRELNVTASELRAARER
ncbi:MAG TPA: helix-turn-helix transcriptional regulator [Kofleriaceae bacterium]|nr:helix-turn-helix transcriptional regulator [Kofleriaceae bacterium]